MRCENCNTDHDGSYGSGRFCSCKCARGFSSKEKRKEINDKVSASMKGRKTDTQNRYTYSFTKKDIKKANESRIENNKKKYLKFFEEGKYIKSDKLRPILLEKQNNKCAICGMVPVWNERPLVFDIDHIDGDPSNLSKENLRAICPNCHRQTETFGGKNMGKHNAREYMKKYLNYDERKKLLSDKRLNELE